MSGVTLTLNVTEDGFNRFFSDIQQKLSPANTHVLLDELGAALVSDTVDRFDRQVEPDGTPWEPSQRALNEGGQTLIDTAMLVSSVTHDVVAGSVTLGTNLVYGAIHQFGGDAGRNKSVEIPERRWLGLDAPQQLIIEGVYTGWLQ